MTQGFVRVAFLDQVTSLAIKGREFLHPFDSERGVEQLREWPVNSKPEHYSYAKSAAAAIPFLTAPRRSELFALAMDHPDPTVQLEGAWGSAKVGNIGGIRYLERACLDAATFTTASSYLKELNLADHIPAALDADFTAEASARTWLAHPQEMGRQPDQIALFDSRLIDWPPTNDRRALRLFKYRYISADRSKADDVGVVMVGGASTFALFSETTAQMSPEDVYALHCCWELQFIKDPRAPQKRAITEGRRLLGWD